MREVSEETDYAAGLIFRLFFLSVFHNLRKPYITERLAVVSQIGNKGTVQNGLTVLRTRKEQQTAVTGCFDVPFCILVLVCRDFFIEFFGEGDGGVFAQCL